MILVGNQRGNSKDMANHLLKAENEQVIVHQIRGFMGNDLHSAFQESYAVSLGTECKQHLYSLSLNSPKDAQVSDAQFVETIDRAEQRLGLTGQPRAIVFHHKHGDDGDLRKHAHAVWCRVDGATMKAIEMPFDHMKLFKLSHELFLENGWKLPKGYTNKKHRDPLNFSHTEYQQSKRTNTNVRDVKKIFQAGWARSDSKEAFAAALKEHGYVLARGDRRAFVAVDAQGEVRAIARYASVKTKDVFARLGEPDNLPSIEQAQEIASKLAPTQRAEQELSPVAVQIEKDPKQVLSLITKHESTFTKHDIAKKLSAYISDPQKYQNAYQSIVASTELVALASDNPKKRQRFTTKEMLKLETGLMNDVRSLAQSSCFGVSRNKVDKSIGDASKDLRQEAGVNLSAEQKEAIRHVTGKERLTTIIGVAGAGKSTMLNAARQAWEESGQRVFGAALAGKAAKGLEQSSGIQSRTLASYELSWKNGTNLLQKGDVLVIDEAGMVGSRQMSRFITEAKDKGVKLVLMGDAEQLQPIEAGSPFRAITKEVKPATLHDVHRQKQGWQKQASKDFALGDTNKALQAYREHKRIAVSKTNDAAIENLVNDYLKGFERSDGRATQIALAHRRADVKTINTLIRDVRTFESDLTNPQTYKTTHGIREFAVGDRLLFTRNDRDLGVKNGMLGTVIKTAEDKLSVELDDKGSDGQKNIRTVSPGAYADFDHGYATTIHKSQGATVKRSYVLASRSMDRHLTYVAMTRHKDATKLYASQEEFKTYSSMSGALSRTRHKEMSTDFERDQSLMQAVPTSEPQNEKINRGIGKLWSRFAKRHNAGNETSKFSEIRRQQEERLERHMQAVELEQHDKAARRVETDGAGKTHPGPKDVERGVEIERNQPLSNEHGYKYDGPGFEM